MSLTLAVAVQLEGGSDGDQTRAKWIQLSNSVNTLRKEPY